MSLDENHSKDNAPRGSGPGVGNSIGDDDELRNDVLDLLRKDPQIDHWAISVSVEDGTVILTGRVHDEAMKTQAEFVLGGVQGVLEVKNDLQVQSASRDEDNGVNAD